MQVIKVPLSEKGITKVINILGIIKKTVYSKEFLEHITYNKIQPILEEITQRNLNTYSVNKKIDNYRNGHKYEVKDNEILIYNKTIITSDEIYSEVRDKYPNGFNLSKAVEYGTGIEGSNSNASAYAAEGNWQYDVNNHGMTGWVYMDNNGEYHWTRGVGGALIFVKLRQKIEENIVDWIQEYIEHKLGGIE